MVRSGSLSVQIILPKRLYPANNKGANEYFLNYYSQIADLVAMHQPGAMSSLKNQASDCRQLIQYFSDLHLHIINILRSIYYPEYIRI